MLSDWLIRSPLLLTNGFHRRSRRHKRDTLLPTTIPTIPPLSNQPMLLDTLNSHLIPLASQDSHSTPLGIRRNQPIGEILRLAPSPANVPFRWWTPGTRDIALASPTHPIILRHLPFVWLGLRCSSVDNTPYYTNGDANVNTTK